jgi:hypothetical protein
MSPLTNKQTITPNKLDETSVKPVEKEQLKSTYLDKGIHFFRGQCIIRVANRFELRQKAYEYIYKIYSNKGFTKNGDGKDLWLSIYDALPETTTLVAEDSRGHIRGTLTVVFDTPIGLPSDEIYKEEIDELRNEGHRISEIVSFGIGEPSKGSVKFLAGLVYSAYLLAWQIKKSTDFVISVHPRYETTYSKKLLFKRIGPVRRYAKVNGAPAILLNLPLSLPSRLKGKKPIFPLSMLNYSEQQEEELSGKIKQMLLPMSDVEFYSFFIEKTDMWERATVKQKNFIKTVYPPQEANHHEVARALAMGFSKKFFFSDVTQNKSTKTI